MYDTTYSMEEEGWVWIPDLPIAGCALDNSPSLFLQSCSVMDRIRAVGPCSQDAGRSSEIVSVWGPGEGPALGGSLVPFLPPPPPVVQHYCKKICVSGHEANLPCYSRSLVRKGTKAFSVVHSSSLFIRDPCCSFCIQMIFLWLMPSSLSFWGSSSRRRSGTS